jgi:hypothetical protein
MDDLWLSTLQTATPQEGFELAAKLWQLGMLLSQAADDVGKGPGADRRATRTQLIAAAHVIALNFQTIAMANDWWRRVPRPNGE